MPPRFPLKPLPGSKADAATLKRWFRRFVEVRDAEGAERCIVSALEEAGCMQPCQRGHQRRVLPLGIGIGARHARSVADMMFAAATEHRYIDTGHPLDFTNKAFEALDVADWGYSPLVLTSLVPLYTEAASRRGVERVAPSGGPGGDPGPRVRTAARCTAGGTRTARWRLVRRLGAHRAGRDVGRPARI